MEPNEKDFLTPAEMDKFLEASKKTKNPKRDYLLCLLLFRHGLRASEATSLRLNDVQLEDATLYIRRKKGGLSNSHPLQADELRAIKAYLKIRDSRSPYLLISGEGSPFCRFTLNYLVKRIGTLAKLPFHVHPHMLRHSCGYYLVNKGFDSRLIQDYLGHRDPKSTVRYTQVNPARFQELFR